MRNQFLFFGLVCCVPSVLTGCSPVSMAKSAFSEIRGAHGEFHAIQPLDAVSGSAIGPIRFSPAFSSVGNRLAPPDLLREYDSAVGKALPAKLAERGAGGSAVLEVNSEFLYFSKKSLMSGATCICRVRGQVEGRPIFDGMVHTESKSFTQGGESALAEATADAVVDYLQKQLPSAK